MNRGKKLQQYVNMSWLLSGAVALLASLFLFLVFGYYNYFRDVKYLQDELESKAQIVARRLSGELLIAPRGAPDAVAIQLAIELNLTGIVYGSLDEITNKPKLKNYIYSEVSVPFLESKYQLRAASLKPSLLRYFNFSILFTCILLIGLTVGTGLFFQTKYLKRHLIRPIESLVDTSTGDGNVSEKWPLELQDISQKLNNSFQERERVIYSHIARGVVHDIKTILQSLKAATDLAKELPTENRLKNLLNVSQTKLPSLLNLIDTTLDGSRDISILPRQDSLVETIYKSIETVRSLPVGASTKIDFKKPDHGVSINHDPDQLERVFTNIIKNGLEAIESKDPQKRILRISFNLADKEFVGIIVEDTGDGLPNAPEAGFRILKSTKPRGSGLGLLISRKIVEAHGGRMIVGRSEDLSGAKFEILLPKGVSL